MSVRFGGFQVWDLTAAGSRRTLKILLNFPAASEESNKRLRNLL